MKPLLRNISPDLSARLRACGHSRVFRTGEQVFREGDKALSLPIVLSGRVKMLHILGEGKEVIVGIFEQGEVFAVPAVFDGGQYPATAIATQPTELLLVKRADFLELLRESPEFSFAVIGWLSGMLREKTATIHDLATASPEHRLGHILLRLAEKEGNESPVRITLRRREIAEMAGLTTETTIRAIRRLADKGLVTIVQGKVIVDPNGPLRRHLVG